MGKVAITAKMARETASMKRRGIMEGGNLLCYKESVEEIDCCHNSTIIFSLLCLPFSFSFTSLESRDFT